MAPIMKVEVDTNTFEYFDDAAGIIVSTILTKQQLIDLYPQLGQPIEEGSEKILIDEIDSSMLPTLLSSKYAL